MSYVDLHATLQDWPYDPEKISVRKILGGDGSVRIQMRVELGIVQMEPDGRPDGVKPRGCATLLDYYKRRLARHQQRNGTGLGFSLSAEDCAAIRQEAALLYRRYVAYFVLEEYDKVARDCAHSLDLFDLCAEHAMEEEDRVALDDYRPYVAMMRARGLAYHAIHEGEPDSALAHVNRGILDIKAQFEQTGATEAMENSDELRILRVLSSELQAKMPEDSVVVTRKALKEAIAAERFEEAARLRDVLREHFSEPEVPAPRTHKA